MAKKDSQKSTKLNSKQLCSIAILSAIPSTYGTMTDVANEVGVCRETLYLWMENEIYMDELNKQTEKNYKSYGSKIRNAHIKYALKGNAQLISLFYKHAEKWIEKTEQTVNVNNLADFLKKKPTGPLPQRQEKPDK